MGRNRVHKILPALELGNAFVISSSSQIKMLPLISLTVYTHFVPFATVKVKTSIGRPFSPIGERRAILAKIVQGSAASNPFGCACERHLQGCRSAPDIGEHILRDTGLELRKSPKR